jgi:hypothetical protein
MHAVYVVHDVWLALPVNVPLPQSVHTWSAIDVPAVEMNRPATQSVYAAHDVWLALLVNVPLPQSVHA